MYYVINDLRNKFVGLKPRFLFKVIWRREPIQLFTLVVAQIMNTNKCTNGQMYKCTNGQMDKWTNGQMDKWTNGQMYKCTLHQKNVKVFFLKTLITDLFAAIDCFCQAKLKNGHLLVPQNFFNPYG